MAGSVVHNVLKRKLVTVIVLIIATTCAWLVYGYYLNKKIQAFEKSWEQDYHNTVRLDNLFNRIVSKLGYGGFIHNFKNLILRRDRARVHALKADLQQLKQLLTTAGKIVKSPDEQKALKQIRLTVSRYQSMIRIVMTRLEEPGITPAMIDRQVRVDDQKAVEAIYFLRDQIQRRQDQILARKRHSFHHLEDMLYAGVWLLLLLVPAGIVVIWHLLNNFSLYQKLSGSQRYLDNLIESAPDTILIVNTRGRIIRANQQAEYLTGYKRHELCGMSVERLVPEKLRSVHTEYRQSAVRQNIGRDFHQGRYFGLINREGEEVPVNISISHYQDDGDLELIVSIRDMTVHKRNEDDLRLAKRVIDSSAGPFIISDDKARIIYCNEAFAKKFGYSQDDILGKTPAAISSGRHDAAFYRQVWSELTKSGNWQGEIWNRNSEGELIASLVNISAIRDNAGEVRNYVAIYSDITALKANEEHLEELAHFDQVTGLPNRLLFTDRLRSSISRADRLHCSVAALYIDLDGFKAVNDTFGHHEGDVLLQRVAEHLEECIRTDDTAARLGGDEFGVILNGIGTREDVEVVLKRMLEKLAVSVVHDNVEVKTTASIGVAIYPDLSKDARSLIENADTAMYNAKKEGKNCYCFFVPGATRCCQTEQEIDEEAADRKDLPSS